MTLFASVALFRRGDGIVFKPPRKEPSPNKTQARKSASRFWTGNITEPDRLNKIVLVQPIGQTIYVCERAINARRDRPWLEFRIDAAEAFKQPHLAACLHELGVDAAQAPPSLPETLEINGMIYRREI